MGSLPTKQYMVLYHVRIQYVRMSLETQGRERAYTIHTFADRAIKLDSSNVASMNTVVAAHKMERERLNRDLTDTELHDLLGWAA